MPIGIELSSVACRIVELGARSRWRRASGPTCVTAYTSWAFAASGPPGAGDAAAKLAPFRGRRASVVLWGLRTDHRHVSVIGGSYERMRIQARARLRDAGMPVKGLLCDIAPVPQSSAGPGRCTVVTASAPRAEVSAALAPLASAGITIHAVLTPAAALQSLARLRAADGSAPPGDGLEAWIALEETAVCIALVRGGALHAARDLSWGFLDELADFQAPRERHDVAMRLADELGAFLTTHGIDGAPLLQVSVCGGMPELRSMTVELMDRLDVEVEPLDSLFAIDEAQLPGSADEFHDAAAGLRMAWAAAANSRPALDLLRVRRRQATRTQLSRAAVLAGAAAGLSLGWWAERQWPSVPSAHRQVVVARSTAALPATVPFLGSHVIAAPSAVLVAGMIPAPLPLPVEPEPGAFNTPVAASKPDRETATLADRPWESVPPLTAPPRMVAVSTAPRVQPVAAARPSRADVQRDVAATTHAPAVQESPVRRPSPVDVPEARPARPPAATPARAPEPDALAFDGSLETILYGRDRSLAIVNGRIVGIGDDVNGARVVEITASAVLLRDRQGRLRRLSLSGQH